MLIWIKLVQHSTRKENDIMKRLGIVVDNELHKELRHYAVNQDKTITDIIVGLVKKELELKKEQTH